MLSTDILVPIHTHACTHISCWPSKVRLTKKRSACDCEEDGMSLNDEEEHFNLVSLLLTKPKVLKLQSVLTIHGLEVEGESKCNLPVIMTYTCKS